MKFDAVLFDCDGVLVDSEPITNGVLRDMLEELGWTLSREECMRIFVGKAVRDEVALINPHWPICSSTLNRSAPDAQAIRPPKRACRSAAASTAPAMGRTSLTSPSLRRLRNSTIHSSVTALPVCLDLLFGGLDGIAFGCGRSFFVFRKLRVGLLQFCDL